MNLVISIPLTMDHFLTDSYSHVETHSLSVGTNGMKPIIYAGLPTNAIYI